MNQVSHIFLMVLYAIGTAGFFSLLWKDEPRERVMVFAIVFLMLLGGGILIALLMQGTFIEQ